ncbi:DUF1414 domain-containing protein [Enterobacteriaceae bacterium ESL0689]|nr:DUF1414 domain-containing protein [Enterobacteriaceae bacterium ESL0689]
MPQLSRYSDKDVEQMLSEICQVLEAHQAAIDLSLIVLGNMVTNILIRHFAPGDREEMAEVFARTLQASIHNSHKPPH